MFAYMFIKCIQPFLPLPKATISPPSFCISHICHISRMSASSLLWSVFHPAAHMITQDCLPPYVIPLLSILAAWPLGGQKASSSCLHLQLHIPSPSLSISDRAILPLVTEHIKYFQPWHMCTCCFLHRTPSLHTSYLSFLLILQISDKDNFPREHFFEAQPPYSRI